MSEVKKAMNINVYMCTFVNYSLLMVGLKVCEKCVHSHHQKFISCLWSGDTSSTVSALCYTVPKSARGSSLHALESGSDYKTRGMSSDNRVIFGPGVSMSTCDVKLIDDSEYELSEEFQLVLSDASDNARMGDVTVAKVIIDGPNDASTVLLGNGSFTFSEDAGWWRSSAIDNIMGVNFVICPIQYPHVLLIVWHIFPQAPLKSLFCGRAVTSPQ